MALRASRRTELERSGKYANHVVNDWFGHSGAIAETHYLQTTEDDFGLAIGSVGLLVGPSVGNQEPLREIGKQKNPGNPKVLMASNGSGKSTSTPNRIRTYNPRFRRPMRYPVAPWVRIRKMFYRSRRSPSIALGDFPNLEGSTLLF